MTAFVIFFALVSLVFLAPWLADRIAERSSIDPPGRSGWFWTTAFLAFLGLMFGLGEVTILAFLVGWLVVWTAKLLPRWMASIPAGLAIAIVSGHLCGYRIYGSPRIADNRPLLQRFFEAVRLEAPNVIVCTDGSKHPVAGIKFSPEILALPVEDQREAIDRTGQPLRFAPDSDRPSGYTVEHRIDYFCGNSFFPSFFPRDLPSHRKEDLAVALRWLVTADAPTQTPMSK
ncbi:MAG: hypothetical protein JNJ83_11820 [Verrucomicrobiaceae bacterium]|nr:hypothetical protein [Verrucomicrobiaceae bacterium]